MLSYDIRIYERNAFTIVKVDSLAETLKLDESLDSGVLTIPRATRKEAFKRFSKVQIKITDSDSYSETRFYLAYTTKSQLNSKYSRITYTHTIGLIEPIKWLEKFQVGSLSFRQPRSGANRPLSNYVDRVLSLAPFVAREKLTTTRVVRLDNNFRNIIALKLAPQIDFEKKNLREVLIGLFKVVNAIPRMYYEDGIWYLTGDFINQRKLPFDIDDNIIDYIEEASGENFAQAAEIHHENTIPDDNAGIIYEGSITDYIYYRSKEIILGESNLKLLTTQKIAELINIYMLVKVYNETLEDYVVTRVNMNDYCVERNVYQSLEFDSGVQSQATTFYWSYRTNEIDGLNETFGAIFQKMAIENIIDSLGNDNYDDVVFQIEYRPYFETMRSIQYREDKDPYIIEDDLLDQYSSLQINQQERLNYLYDLTDNIYGQIQRLGIETVSTSKKHYSLAPYHPDTNPNGIYQVGDYTSSGYIVTKVERVYFTPFIIARYELSKNWNRIAQFIQIDQEFRPYEISMEKNDATVKRNILFNMGFVEISLQDRENLVQGFDLKTVFMKTFEPQLATAELGNLTMMVIKPRNLNYVLVFPCGSLAEKNGLKWKLDMLDTKLAGKRIVNEKRNLLQQLVQTQEGVYYTDNNGELRFLTIGLTQDLNRFAPLEIMSDTQREEIKSVAINFPRYDNNVDLIYETPLYDVYKDSGEILGFELHLPILPESTYYNIFVIGESLIKENQLIKPSIDLNAKRFVGLTERISKSNSDKIDIVGKFFVLISDFDIDDNSLFVSNTITDYDYYAITDSDGNLYLGVNQLGLDNVKTTVGQIFFNFRENRYRPDIEISQITLEPLLLINETTSFTSNMGMNISPILEIDTTLDYQSTQFIYQVINLQQIMVIDTSVIQQVQRIDYQVISIQPTLEIDSDTTSVSGQIFIESIEIQPIFTLETETTYQTAKVDYEVVNIQAVLTINADIVQTTITQGTLSWLLIDTSATQFATPTYDYNLGTEEITNIDVYDYIAGEIIMINNGELPATYYLYEAINTFN